MTRRRLLSRRSAVLVAGALVLAALLAATWGIETWALARLGASAGVRAQEQTVDEVRAALGGMLREMRELADATAVLPEVRAALASGRDSGAVDAAAIEAVATLGTPGRMTVEVVSPSGEVVAWDGPAFPLPGGRTPDTLRTRVVFDEGRRAVTLWRPVEVGGEAVGAVRVVRLVQARVPVSNRYLQDYDVADEWRSSIAEPFTVRFTRTGGRGGPRSEGPTGVCSGVLRWGSRRSGASPPACAARRRA